MNCTRLALAAVAGTVFDACYGVTVYGMLLAPEFAKYPGVYRAADVGPSYLPLMFAGILLAVAVVTVIYAKGYEGRGAGEGVRFGALVAAFGTCAFSGVNYATLNIGRRFALEIAAAGFVEWFLIGVIVAAVYKPSQAAAAKPAGV
ncbi:MAG TPA: hypothetical protein VFA27_09330 [Vicinamibacterales bacterium]|nr:hypothetical protein [Vicinamibacterales bacterium]